MFSGAGLWGSPFTGLRHVTLHLRLSQKFAGSRLPGDSSVTRRHTDNSSTDWTAILKGLSKHSEDLSSDYIALISENQTLES